MTPHESALAAADRAYPHIINGERCFPADARTFSCFDPFLERPWGTIPIATAETVNEAVQAARQAFDDSSWSSSTGAYRAKLLRKLADLIARDAEVLATQQVLENGKRISELRPNVDVLMSDLEFFAGLAEYSHGFTMPSSLPNFETYTVREPIGVVAAITPWNTPLVLLGWKLFPALAAGNTVVIKPSEVTPTSTLLLVELMLEAGFPPGVVNVVNGPGTPTGEALVDHRGIEKVAFTGSTATGIAIARRVVDRNLRVSLEMGGKSPSIVFADADLENAVNGVMAGIFAASGQSCMGGSRVLVHESVMERFAAKLAERARHITFGDPFDPDTQMGPLASMAQLKKVTEYFQVAVSDGATVLAGGKRPQLSGLFVEPTVLTDVTNEARVAREEIFGPVVTLLPFADEAEAISVANDSPYGLAAGIWTEDLRRAHRVSRKLRAGTVWINNYRILQPGMPFGGFKMSGQGREMGIEALHGYTETKSIQIDLGNEIQFK